MLIEAIAPALARKLADSVAHNEVAAIESQTPDDREALYAILDSMLSGKAGLSERNNAERVTIVRVRWQTHAAAGDKPGSMYAALDHAIAAATASTSHIIRIRPSELLIVGALHHLVAAGLGPSAQQRTPRATEIEVAEIANSLQLREALALTTTSDVPAPSARPSIH